MHSWLTNETKFMECNHAYHSFTKKRSNNGMMENETFNCFSPNFNGRVIKPIIGKKNIIFFNPCFWLFIRILIDVMHKQTCKIDLNSYHTLQMTFMYHQHHNHILSLHMIAYHIKSIKSAIFSLLIK